MQNRHCSKTIHLTPPQVSRCLRAQSTGQACSRAPVTELPRNTSTSAPSRVYRLPPFSLQLQPFHDPTKGASTFLAAAVRRVTCSTRNDTSSGITTAFESHLSSLFPFRMAQVRDKLYDRQVRLPFPPHFTSFHQRGLACTSHMNNPHQIQTLARRHALWFTKVDLQDRIIRIYSVIVLRAVPCRNQPQDMKVLGERSRMFSFIKLNDASMLKVYRKASL